MFLGVASYSRVETITTVVAAIAMMSNTTVTVAPGNGVAAPPIDSGLPPRGEHAPPVIDELSGQPIQTLPSESSDSDKPMARFSRDSRMVACLVSTILHTAVLIVLALWLVPAASRSGLSLKARTGKASVEIKLKALPKEKPEQSKEAGEAQLPTTKIVAQSEPSIETSTVSQWVHSAIVPTSSAQPMTMTDSNSTMAMMKRLPSGGGLEGRTPEGRQKYGQMYGATKESEDAVEKALAWLAKHQRRNGSWSFDLSLDPCSGRCSHSRDAGDTPTPTTAATGLSLLAFLGAGYTHHEGKYADNVRKGLYYLRASSGPSKHGLDWQHGSMYGHGIALLAINEALSMSRSEAHPKGDTDLRSLAEEGSMFSSIAQHRGGSWGYRPGQPGDMTITGWQTLSLKAAQRNHIPLPTPLFYYVHEFVMSTSEGDEFAFGYKGPPAEENTTAIGLALLLYLGQSPDDPRFTRAAEKLAYRGPKLTDLYHDYYATLALHHSRHHSWDRWNSQVRDHLVQSQSSEGHETGSWHFKDKHGDIGGRLYSTAMATMILEVYYRYLPLYEELDEFPL